MFGDEDEDEYDFDEDEEESNFSDDDLYEVPMTEAEWRAAQEHNHDGDGLDSEEDEPAGFYHAFVADSLSTAKPSPIVYKELHGADSATSAAPIEVVSSSTISVQGSKFRRPVVLPAALMNKRRQQTEQEHARLTARADLTATKRPVVGEFTIGHRPTGAGMAIMNAPGLTLLDPVTGSFETNNIKTSATHAARTAQKDMSCAYIKEISGNELGCRVWDGAVFLIRFFHRLLQQTQTWVDGLRVLELGSGTGVAGIYLWHMIAQRALAQVMYARQQGNVSKDSLSDAFALLSFRDNESLHDNQVRVTNALNAYGAKSPLVAVTDMEPVASLLRGNVKLNQTTKYEMFSAKTNPLIKHGSPSGLHVFELAWGEELSRAVLKVCGISVEHGRVKDFSAPEADSFVANECFNSLRQSITSIYKSYRSLRRAKELAPLKPLLGLDMVFASECLYNDRHFPILIDSIKKLFVAHAFAHAQIADAQKQGVDIDFIPAKTFPLILLSYRIRAIEEEEGIINGFFRPLEEMGIYHTSISIDRVLSNNDDITVAQTDRAVHDTVHQRFVERVERENGIKNVLGDLEKERLKTTRFAVMYQCPNKWLPASSCDPALYENHQGELPPSPLPLLSPNATIFFKLFQAL